MTVLEFDLVGNYFTVVISMVALLGVVCLCRRFATSWRSRAWEKREHK